MSSTNPSAPHGHGHDAPALGAASPDSVKAGHEPDNNFAVKPIMAIPLAVVFTFVIAFSVAAGAFVYWKSRKPKDAFAHPEAVKRNEEGTNERLSRIARAGLFKESPEFDQPRLEPLRRLEGDGMWYARPPVPQGNSPEIHPEEIQPGRVALLHTIGFVDRDKKHARIPIDEAMKLAVKEKLFPVQKNGSKPTPTAYRPTAASGGIGIQPVVEEGKAPPKAKEQPKETPKTKETPKPPVKAKESPKPSPSTKEAPKPPVKAKESPKPPTKTKEEAKK